MALSSQPRAEQRAHELADYYAALPQVAAIALGGSRSGSHADTQSDIDLYVYTTAELPTEVHTTLIEQSGGTSRADLGLPYWGGINTWIDAPTGIMIDCVVFGTPWMEDQIRRVLDHYQPSEGYSTCFCRTVQQSQILYDPQHWLQALQARVNEPYPEALRRNIIAHNHPMLRALMTSYMYQINSAVRRGDLISMNHRLAALLASYFDIVFAFNRVFHPGEKRLVAYAKTECTLLPTEFESDLAMVAASAGTASADLPLHLGRLLDRLDEILSEAEVL